MSIIQLAKRSNNSSGYGKREFISVNDAIQSLHNYSLIVPQFQNELDSSEFVRYFGMVDIDIDWKYESKSNSIKDAKAQYCTRLKEENEMTLQDWVDKSNGFAHAYETACTLLRALKTKLSPDEYRDTVFYFTGCKGFRILWYDPKLYVKFDTSYKQYYKQVVAPSYFQEYLGLDSDYVDSLDSSIHEHNHGIKTEFRVHPLSDLYAITLPLNEEKQLKTILNKSKENYDKKLAEKICNFIKTIVLEIPDDLDIAKIANNKPKKKNKMLQIDDEEQEKEEEEEETKSIRMNNGLIHHLLSHCNTVQQDNEFGEANVQFLKNFGNSSLWKVNGFCYCMRAQREHDKDTDVYFVINSSESCILQKCFSLNCKDEEPFKVFESRSLKPFNKGNVLLDLINTVKNFNYSKETVQLVNNANEGGRGSVEWRKAQEHIAAMKRNVFHTMNQYFAHVANESQPCIMKLINGTQKCNDELVAMMRYESQSHENFFKSTIQLEVPMYTIFKNKFILQSVHLAKEWIRSPICATFNKIYFIPKDECFNNNFNLWTGFRVGVPSELLKQTNKSYEQIKAGVQPILDHIWVIWCNCNENLYSYVLHWFASILIQPWKKIGTALVLKGKEGCGKGIIVNILGSIIGRAHYSHIMHISELTGKFSGPALRTAVLTYVDEASFEDDKKELGVLKKLITEDTHHIEDKYVSATTTDSYVNYVFASNEEHIMPVGDGARRFCFLQMNDKYAGPQTKESKQYFDRIQAVPVELFACYLYETCKDSIATFNFRQVPATTLLTQQRVLSMGGTVSGWFLDCLKAINLPGTPHPIVKAGNKRTYNDTLDGMQIEDDDVEEEETNEESEEQTIVKKKEEWIQPRLKTEIYDHYKNQVDSKITDTKFWMNLNAIIASKPGLKLIGKQRQIRGLYQKRALHIEFPSYDECCEALKLFTKDPNILTN